ncbi:MAG TPA: response regulator [Ferruginibacter sp.]|nr:response regulator [Ferruginibacter sp.]
MLTVNSLTKTILLADDDADDRLLFEEALKEVAEYSKLTTAKDGEHLMEILHTRKEGTPDVIFLDLNMPLKNGFECLRQIKESHIFKDIPVIVYSTSCQHESIQKTYEQGASYYICKPNTYQKLIKSIQHIFSVQPADLNSKPPFEDFVIAY